MSRKELLAKVIEHAIVGVVRENSAEAAAAVADAYATNGIRIVEVTFTTPGALDLMASLAARYAGEVTIAAGTTRSSNDAAAARRAGAEIIVSPHTNVRVIEYANENELLAVAGAATPTEIIQAWEAGCDVVKVFPAAAYGGPDYIRTIRGPIRDVAMLAGGPIPLDMIESYLDAGCIAVNLGISLAVPDLVKTQQWDEIGRRALLASSIIESRRVETEPNPSYVH